MQKNQESMCETVIIYIQYSEGGLNDVKAMRDDWCDGAKTMRREYRKRTSSDKIAEYENVNRNRLFVI